MDRYDTKIRWILSSLPASLVVATRTAAACAAAFTFAGCATSGNRAGHESGALTIGGKNGSNVAQVGPVSAGGKISVADSVSSFIAPAGSTVNLSGEIPGNARETTKAMPRGEGGGVLTLSQPTPFHIASKTQTAEGPKSFAPPAPPSPAEIATGAGIRIFYWVAAALAVVSVVCFYTSHTKAGLVAAAGAGALPLLASFSSFAASHATVGVVAVVCALVVAWYFVRGKIETNNNPNTPQEIQAMNSTK